MVATTTIAVINSASPRVRALRCCGAYWRGKYGVFRPNFYPLSAMIILATIGSDGLIPGRAQGGRGAPGGRRYGGQAIRGGRVQSEKVVDRRRFRDGWNGPVLPNGKPVYGIGEHMYSVPFARSTTTRWISLHPSPDK